MSGLIASLQEQTARSDERPRVLDVAGAESDEVLDALGPNTRRALYRTLFAEPGTPSEIARRVDTSVQNVYYHLSTLEEAGLIEPVDTRYSEKGNEMTVYAPASDPLVFVGDREKRPRIQRSLTEVLAGFGILGVASLLVQWGAERLVAQRLGPASVVGPASRSGAEFGPQEVLAWTVFEVVEPGVLFFFGCLAMVGIGAYLMDR